MILRENQFGTWYDAETGTLQEWYKGTDAATQAHARNVWSAQQSAGGAQFPKELLPYLPQAKYSPDADGYFTYVYNGTELRINDAHTFYQTGQNQGVVFHLLDPFYNGWNRISEEFIPDLRARLKEANNGGFMEAAIPVVFMAAAAWAGAQVLSGSLSPAGSLAAEADIETITVTMTETQGASTVGETGLSWYEVDPGIDPFATTDAVNAGWSFDGGYAGVDWYNSAGIGEASAGASSLADIFGKVTSTIKAAGGAVAAASGALQATRNNLAQPQPNYTRAAGGINVGLLAVGLLAWKLL